MVLMAPNKFIKSIIILGHYDGKYRVKKQYQESERHSDEYAKKMIEWSEKITPADVWKNL